MNGEIAGQELRGCLEVATKLKEAVRFTRYHLDRAHILLMENIRLEDLETPGYAAKAVRNAGIKPERMYRVSYGSGGSMDIEECRPMGSPQKLTLPPADDYRQVKKAERTIKIINEALEDNDAPTFTTDFEPILNICKMANMSEGIRFTLKGHMLTLETCETHIRYMSLVGTDYDGETTCVYPVEYLIILLSMADKKNPGCDYNLSVTFAFDQPMHARIAIKGGIWSAYLAPRTETGRKN